MSARLEDWVLARRRFGVWSLMERVLWLHETPCRASFGFAMGTKASLDGAFDQGLLGHGSHAVL
jgi:hypothetical protein